MFIKTFPDGAKINIANIKKAQKAGLNLDWFAKKFLGAKALRDYDAVCDKAWRNCDAVCDKAWRNCEAVCAQALRNYGAVCDKAWRNCDAVCDKAWRNCEAVCGKALLKAFDLEVK